MIKVLFVCLGNICRSPAAEAVFRSVVGRHHLDQRILVDSAGTSGVQVGRAPDPRAQKIALRRGFDVSRLRARQIGQADFARFHHIIAMDRANLDDLRDLSPPQYRERIQLFFDIVPHPSSPDVPDPYLASGLAAFEEMFDLIEAGCAGLLPWLRQAHAAELDGPVTTGSAAAARSSRAGVVRS
ncbi:MAG: low molecular weight phosphotyrosine protein phosphatase [Rhodospirillales bacterium]|nr:low molecular weight phosphotyrosine protein phosphatase [Rhodospirillales bacterium]